MNVAICCLALIAGNFLHAQDTSVLPPPQAPFLMKFIKPPAAWTIIYKAKKVPSSKQPDGSSAVVPERNGLRVITSVQVVKMADKRVVISNWSDGTKSERWLFDGLTLTTFPGSSDGFVEPPTQPPGMPPLETYTDTDFPEFGWIQANMYQPEPQEKDPSGQKQPHYFFRMVPPEISATRSKHPEKIFDSGNYTQQELLELTLRQANASDPQPMRSTLQGWIDASTKLPIALDDGEYLKFYSFDPHPPTSLEIPAQIAKILAERKAFSDQSSKHLIHEN